MIDKIKNFLKENSNLITGYLSFIGITITSYYMGFYLASTGQNPPFRSLIMWLLFSFLYLEIVYKVGFKNEK